MFIGVLPPPPPHRLAPLPWRCCPRASVDASVPPWRLVACGPAIVHSGRCRRLQWSLSGWFRGVAGVRCSASPMAAVSCACQCCRMAGHLCLRYSATVISADYATGAPAAVPPAVILSTARCILGEQCCRPHLTGRGFLLLVHLLLSVAALAISLHLHAPPRFVSGCAGHFPCDPCLLFFTTHYFFFRRLLCCLFVVSPVAPSAMLHQLAHAGRLSSARRLLLRRPRLTLPHPRSQAGPAEPSAGLQRMWRSCHATIRQCL